MDWWYAPFRLASCIWLFLIGASMVELTAWGMFASRFPYCYGVFREYFFTHELFKGQAIVSTGGGVLQITVLIVIYTCNIFSYQRKKAMWLGCLLYTISPISAAFTTSISTYSPPFRASALVVLLGPLLAGLLFAPSMHFLDDWFEGRKSFAFGIICGVGAAGGAGFPPAYTVSLNKYGYKTTLIGFGLITLVVTVAGILLVGLRTPPEKAVKPTWQDVDFVRKPLFLLFLASTLVQGTSHYGSSACLPAFHRCQLRLSGTQGALLVSLLNPARAIGQPLQGAIADTNASFYAFARKLWSLVIFSLAFGATAGGFAALRPRFARASILIFGVFTAARGAAIIASGFVAVTLVHAEDASLARYGLGSRWRDLINFTGVVMASASFGALGGFIFHTLRF
ncbi:major facilitator superfamily domain-containing protein [Xylaria castorea]|nr:major facilitator superfamily domain-containing protein [Xylaria castorea]